jgi:fibronectin-binding autotransporter adhesin
VNFVVGYNKMTTAAIGTGTSTVNATITVAGGTLDMGSTGRIILGDRFVSGNTAGGFVNSSMFLTSGTLKVAQNIAQGNNQSPSGGLTSRFVFDGGTLQLTGAPAVRLFSTVNPNVSAGGAIIDTGTFSTNISTNLVETSTSTGGGLTKNGAGTLSLAGTSTFTGATTINGGTLSVGGTSAAAGGAGILGGGSYAGTISVATGAAFVFNNSAATQTLSGNITGGGSLTKANGSTLNLTGSASSLGGSVAFNGGQTTLDPGASGGFSSSGRFQMAAPASATAVLDIVSGSNSFSSAGGIAGIGDNAGTSTLNVNGGSTTFTINGNRMLIGNKGVGIVTVNGGRLAITGSQAITVGGDSQFALDNASGTITVTSGTLEIQSPGVLQLGVNVSGTQYANTTNANGTINLNGGVFATARPITTVTGTNPSTGTINFNGGTLRALASSTSFVSVTTANVQNGGAVIDTNGHDVTIAQPLVGAGSGGLSKTGAGTLILSGSSSLTGSTSIQQGTLQLANTAALASSQITPGAGGTLTLAPYLQTTVGGLAPNAGGLVDVGNGMVTVATGLTVADMLTAITAGYNGGTWTGTAGITSSTAAADTAGGAVRAIGWLDNGGGSVTFAFAAPGDTNLDGLIDVLDAAALSSAGRFNDTAVWSEGDFNYDGIYDDLDNALFVSTGLFDAGPYNAPPGAVGAVAAVPEPSTSVAVLAGLLGAGFLAARRHRPAGAARPA